MRYKLHHGDCLAILPTLEDCSVDAIVTDPPAGIAFMGKAWDRDKGGKTEWIDWMFEVALQCRRVIKPGGHALVWAIPRTSHWTGSAWEDAGWQVRDKIYHVFGSGFPKSMDVSKAIDKSAGAEREVVGHWRPTGTARPSKGGSHSAAKTTADCGYTPDNDATVPITAPATPEAKQWDGWGTALKPAAEEWWLFRKPLEGTVAANVLKHGTGAINVDGARIPCEGGSPSIDRRNAGAPKMAASMYRSDSHRHDSARYEEHRPGELLGRWPANFTHDGSDEVTALLGDAARFFYSPKASKADRDEGCDGLEARRCGGMSATQDASMLTGSGNERTTERGNHHPTVKPVDLMTYLCRLITPPGGTILDPFTGSGSTGKAAMAEGFRFIGIEREAEYIEIAQARISAEAEKPRQLSLF